MKEIATWFYYSNLEKMYPHARPMRSFEAGKIEKETEKAVYAMVEFWANGTFSFNKMLWIPKSVLTDVES